LERETRVLPWLLTFREEKRGRVNHGGGYGKDLRKRTEKMASANVKKEKPVG
jgi:hypothetical protein